MDRSAKAKVVELAKYVQNELREELIQQGHRATGNGVRSITYEIAYPSDNRFEITFSYNRYLLNLEKRRDPDKIPFSRPGRGGTSKFIDALTKWAMVVGAASDIKEAKSVAFAVATKMKQEGSPTKGAFAFSRNGRRTGWQAFTLQKVGPVVESSVSDIFEIEIERLFENEMSKL